jgi:hypothetical protein
MKNLCEDNIDIYKNMKDKLVIGKSAKNMMFFNGVSKKKIINIIHYGSKTYGHRCITSSLGGRYEVTYTTHTKSIYILKVKIT